MSGRISVAGLVCFKPGERGRLFYRARVLAGLLAAIRARHRVPGR